MIRILMPLADGHKQKAGVLRGLAMQDAEIELLPLSRPVAPDRRLSEASTRQELVLFADGNYTCMMDSDVVLTGVRDISDCVAFLEDNHQWDAVALNTKTGHDARWLSTMERTGHVIIAFAVYRSDALRKVKFEVIDGCLCPCVNKQLAIRYLDGRQLLEVKR